VIEIDGDSHADPDQAKYDTARTSWFEEPGYRMIRLAAGEVEEDLAGVVCPSRSSSRSFGFAQDEASRGARDAPGKPPGLCTRRGCGRRARRGSLQQVTEAPN